MMIAVDYWIMRRVDAMVLWLWNKFEVPHMWLISVSFLAYVASTVAYFAVHTATFSDGLICGVSVVLYWRVRVVRRRGVRAFNALVMHWRTSPISHTVRMLVILATAFLTGVRLGLHEPTMLIDLAWDWAFFVYFLVHQAFTPEGPSKRRRAIRFGNLAWSPT